MRFPDANLAEYDEFNRHYPVGCVYQSVVDTNPALLFGFGTWVAFGAGRVLVGVDAGDPDFDAAEKTSGAKAVTLTTAQIPAHTHLQDAHGHTVTDPGHTHTLPVGATDDTAAPFDRADAGTNAAGANATTATGSNQTGVTVGNTTAVNQNAGGGQSHSNVQPSVAVFIFKRVA
jgi:microcystin-dependent protein